MPYPYPLVFSTLGTPDWSLERAAEQAVADGYAGLEIRILDGQVISPHLPAERRAAIRSLLTQHGLVIAGIGASTRFSSPDADDRAQQLAELRAYLALANDLNVPIVRTFGGNVSDGQTVQDAVDQVANSLAEAMPDAERYGVTVCLETHDAFCRGEEVAGVLRQVIHHTSRPSGTFITPTGWANRSRRHGTSSATAWPTCISKTPNARRTAAGNWF